MSHNKRENWYCNCETDLQVIKKLILKSWINLLLRFIPIGVSAHISDFNPIIAFFTNFATMISLANVLGASTECLWKYLGATFGNAVELVVMILASLKAKTSENTESREIYYY